MADIALEVFEAWPVREVALGGKSETTVQEASCDPRTVVTGYMPFVYCIVPRCCIDSGIV